MSRPRPDILNELRRLIPKASRILVAYSGGADSTALLTGLKILEQELQLSLATAHVNHKLRPASDKDEDFISETSRRLGLQCFVKVLDPSKINGNIEAWGRKERYKFFKELLLAEGFDYVLTAHHADDVAETFLMKILSNKEPRGIQEFDPKRKLIRPLLAISKRDILCFLAQQKMEHINDESNENNSFLRNRIRNCLIPFLSENFDNRISEVLSERERELDELYQAVDELNDEIIAKCSSCEFGTKEWLSELRSNLEKLPDGLKFRLIQRILEPALSYRLARKHCNHVLSVINQENHRTELPRGIFVELVKGELRLRHP